VSTRFADRHQAGQALAQRLLALPLPTPRVVLALPRGGVPVAAPIALALRAPLDLLLVRKIGAPQQPELALAAAVEGEPPDIVVADEVQRHVRAEAAYIEAVAARELREIARQRQAYLHGRAAVPIQGATVIVVDDGVATGTTLRAALKALRRRRPARLVLAVPVAPRATLAALRAEVDDCVCLATPTPFEAVGAHYVDFAQVEDRDVIDALDAAARATLDVQARDAADNPPASAGPANPKGKTC
jgi:putative phosphoribosyl transferase